MSNYCKSKGIYCEFTTDLGFCSVTTCNKENRVSNTFIAPTVFVTDTPMVEYAPVVRCKDCKWWDRKESSNYGYCNACKHGHYSEHWEIQIYRTYKDDWFCADGERDVHE